MTSASSAEEQLSTALQSLSLSPSHTAVSPAEEVSRAAAGLGDGAESSGVVEWSSSLQPCSVCGFALPPGWSSSPSSASSSLSFYFSRLRASDAADVSAKVEFWAPLMRSSQLHLAHSDSDAASSPRLCFSLASMQRRFTRHGDSPACLEAVLVHTSAALSSFAQPQALLSLAHPHPASLPPCVAAAWQARLLLRGDVVEAQQVRVAAATTAAARAAEAHTGLWGAVQGMWTASSQLLSPLLPSWTASSSPMAKVGAHPSPAPSCMPAQLLPLLMAFPVSVLL